MCIATASCTQSTSAVTWCRAPTAISLHLRQRLLCLREPEGHLHVAIQVDGGGQSGTCLLLLTLSGVQHAEAAVAMRLERAHAQLLGQGEGLAVVGFGLLDIGGIS